MTASRLASVAPELSDALQRAAGAQRRAAALRSCERVVAATGVGDAPPVAAAMEALRTGVVPRAHVRADLEALAARLDDEYFARERDRGRCEESLRAFSRARAVSALAFAASADDGVLHEAIYEATAAVDDARDVIEAAQAALLPPSTR